MHAIPANSSQSILARLSAKRDHADRRPQTKPEQRRRKSDRRDFRMEIAQVIYPCWHNGVEL